MVDRFQPLAVTKLAIVAAAFLIAGAGLLLHGHMTKQPTFIRCADVIENYPCSPREQTLYYVKPMVLGGVFGGK
jgi:hypothetical protein